MDAELNWRPMRADDLEKVIGIAAALHPDYPEDDAVLAEKFTLYPRGCFMLETAQGDALGYTLSHPFIQFAVPALNGLLGALPHTPTTYYWHDIAILPEGQGRGAARFAANMIAGHARNEGFKTVSLCAVNGSAARWAAEGFRAEDRPGLSEKLKTYSEDACFMVRKL